MTLRTTTLRINEGADFTANEWAEPKSPLDDLDYSVDVGPWLDDARRALLSADIYTIPGSIAIRSISYGPVPGPRRVVTVRLAGGVPGTQVQVFFSLTLDAGRRLNFPVSLLVGAASPAEAAPFISPDALLVAGQPLTIGGAPLTP